MIGRAAQEVDDPVDLVTDLASDAVDEQVTGRPQVRRADDEGGEPPEGRLVDDDGAAAVRAAIAGARVAAEAKLPVVGVDGSRVGDRGAESEESVEAHAASGPAPATQVLCSSPMMSAPE